MSTVFHYSEDNIIRLCFTEEIIITPALFSMKLKGGCVTLL